MKNLLRFVLPLVAIVYLSSCNSHSDKEYEELKAVNDSLIGELKLCEKNTLDGEPLLKIITLSQIRKGIRMLYDSANHDEMGIHIPISWRFEENELRDMLDMGDNGGVKKAIGLMAYPIIDTSTNWLKIALVPYYEGSNRQLFHYAPVDDMVGAYDFSTICPPDNGCIVNSAIVTDVVTSENPLFNSYNFVGNGVSERVRVIPAH